MTRSGYGAGRAEPAAWTIVAKTGRDLGAPGTAGTGVWRCGSCGYINADAERCGMCRTTAPAIAEVDEATYTSEHSAVRRMWEEAHADDATRWEPPLAPSPTSED